MLLMLSKIYQEKKRDYDTGERPVLLIFVYITASSRLTTLQYPELRLQLESSQGLEVSRNFF